jgi:hypothetical protein
MKKPKTLEEAIGIIAVLEDLLETAGRLRDEARDEANKADNEALEHKVRNLGKAAEDLAGSYALIKIFQARAEIAEAELKKYEKAE